jgi:DNA-binding MarR family transcriptional regulator
MPSPETEARSGYWYVDPDDGGTAGVTGVDVLNALRTYRAAEAEMRRRTRESMGMGETDLLALRYLLQSQRRGLLVTPKDLAARLGISSASVTVLIDRLVASGHLERRPHPTDGRSKVIVTTASSDDEVRATLGAMHRRMIDVADRLSKKDAAVVARFLEEMTESVASTAE